MIFRSVVKWGIGRVSHETWLDVLIATSKTGQEKSLFRDNIINSLEMHA